MSKTHPSIAPRRRAASLRCGVVLVLLFTAISVIACSVPVFRYALERWPADPYQAVLFHRGSLTAEEKEQIAILGESGLAGRLGANLNLTKVNLDEASNPSLQALWEEQGTNMLPWLVVQSPPSLGAPRTLYAGPVETETIKTLLDSPMRQEIVKRITQGETAVWVLLEIGDQAADDKAAATLEKELQRLEANLQLPTIEQADIAAGLVTVPPEALKVDFSVLRLSRKNAEERNLARMLLGVEEDLMTLNQPMAFPIFGRGRALYALVGPGINSETIEEACAFLTGACSCQVKELNPGVDLLLAAHWDDLIRGSAFAEQELPPLSGFVEFALEPEETKAAKSEPMKVAKAEATTENAAEGETAADAAPASEEGTKSTEPSANAFAESEPRYGFLLSGLLIVALGGAAIVGAATFILLRRKP